MGYFSVSGRLVASLHNCTGPVSVHDRTLVTNFIKELDC